MVSSVLNVTFSFQCSCLQVARDRDREGTVTAWGRQDVGPEPHDCLGAAFGEPLGSFQNRPSGPGQPGPPGTGAARGHQCLVPLLQLVPVPVGGASGRPPESPVGLQVLVLLLSLCSHRPGALGCSVVQACPG